MCPPCARRARRVPAPQAHAYIVGHLKKEMPSYFGAQKAQAKLLANIEEHFLKVQWEESSVATPH